MAVSQNGWKANDRGVVSRRQVPGTDVSLTVRNGIPGDLLIWVAEQVHKRVEPISNGRGAVDDWGYAERPIRGGTELSNHASGTAIDLNATKHPLGKANTFTTKQQAEIRRIIAETGGAVRWGGDYKGRKDDMHFEIDANAAGVNRAWKAIQAKQQTKEDDNVGYIIPFEVKAGWTFDHSGHKRNHPEYLTVINFDWANWSKVEELGPARLTLGTPWCIGQGTTVNGKELAIDEGVRLRVEIGLPGDDGGEWWPRFGKGGIVDDAVVEFGLDSTFFAEALPDKTFSLTIGRVPRTEDPSNDPIGGWWPVSGAVIFDKKPQ